MESSAPGNPASGAARLAAIDLRFGVFEAAGDFFGSGTGFVGVGSALDLDWRPLSEDLGESRVVSTVFVSASTADCEATAAGLAAATTAPAAAALAGGAFIF